MTLMKNPYRSVSVCLVGALLLYLDTVVIEGCTEANSRVVKSLEKKQAAISNTISSVPTVADAATIMNRPQVPILCYHQLRDFRSTDSKTAKDYIVPVASFNQQIKLLADSGYHSILPDQLYDYLAFGKPLPEKPVMITFDDTRLEHFTIASTELNKYGFKGVFFIMTVSLDRPGYMSKEQVKQLAEQGHIIGLHTWNHKNVKTFTEEDWPVQIDKPWEQLKQITGKPVDYFAYPFGICDQPALEKIKACGFKAAFQLSTRREENFPLFCIRRIIVPGEWSSLTMYKHMKSSF